MQYLLEVQLKGQEKWSAVNTFKTMEATVSNLNPGEEYLFRITAVNDKGKSDPKVLSGPVMTKNLVFEPDVRPEFSSYSVHVGKDINIDIPIFGRPKPTITWTKDGAPLKFTTRVHIVNTPTHTTLSIKEAAGDDGGMYSINVANSAGKKDTTIEVIVLDKPGPPCGPVRFDEITTQSVTISWDPPKHNGGCQISNYVVQKRDTTTTTWENVSINWARTTIKVPRLKTGIQVCALNKLGVGEPAVLSGTAKPEERVEPPEIHLDSELRKGIVLKAGGSVRINIPFKGRPTPEIKWTKDDGNLTEKPVVEKAHNFTQLSIDSCDRSDSGKYTLTLTNSSGTVSEVISVKILDAPGAPQNLVVKEIRKDSVTLAWDAPLIDGGAKIKNYVIDKRESTRKGTDKWGVATNTKTCEGTVTGLTAGTEYLFRIIAYNEKGKSEPKALAAPVIATDMTMEPSIKIPFNTYSVLAGKDLKLDFPVLGKPKPKVTWAKDGQPLKVTSRMNIISTKTTTGIEITEACKEDFGKYTITAANTTGTTAEDVSVIILDKPELDAELRKVLSVRAGGTLRLFVTIRGRPEPAVKWEKVDSTLTERAVIDTTSSFTMLVIDNVNRFDSGKYSLTLENSSGKKSAIVAVRILDTPSAPQNFTVKELKKDSVTLAWDTPLTDGGSKITNYIIEKRESVRKAYAAVTSNCTANSFKVEDLPEGGIFYFRICAVNEYGQGQMVETKEVKVAEVPLPPSKVTLVDLTKTSVSLAWEKPAHDGGCKVMCYNVEFKPKSGDKWGTACTVKVPEATIPNLTPNEAYLFRVVAINEKGKSEPKDLGLPVAGGDLTFEVPIRGRPKPAVSWKKDGLPLKQTTSVSILNTAASSKIIIKEAKKEHVGKYEMTLANTAGTVTADIGVIVLDKPGPPKGIKVDAVTSDSISLSWSPPEYDGGCSISNYIVEKRDTNTQEWQMIASNVARTAFKAGRLTHGAEYQFRIYAVTTITKSTMVVEWGKPGVDGGSAVTGYYLERRDKKSLRWIRVYKEPVTDAKQTVYHLTEGNEYQYRVCAINKAGEGPFSDASDYYKAADPVGKYT
uniref:Titin n=1 Tax=Pundamilia nyererei TaxID=303518 RepID=A0A3B4HBL7_9CICH